LGAHAGQHQRFQWLPAAVDASAASVVDLSERLAMLLPGSLH
jgi:hypothetical protein